MIYEFLGIWLYFMAIYKLRHQVSLFNTITDYLVLAIMLGTKLPSPVIMNLLIVLIRHLLRSVGLG